MSIKNAPFQLCFRVLVKERNSAGTQGAAVALQPEGGQKIVLLHIVTEGINVVADHEGKLLERPGLPFPLPRIRSKQGIHLR